MRVSRMTARRGQLGPTGRAARPGWRPLPGGPGEVRQGSEALELFGGFVIFTCAITPRRRPDRRRHRRWLGLSSLRKRPGGGYCTRGSAALVKHAVELLHARLRALVAQL